MTTSTYKATGNPYAIWEHQCNEMVAMGLDPDDKWDLQHYYSTLERPSDEEEALWDMVVPDEGVSPYAYLNSHEDDSIYLQADDWYKCLETNADQPLDSEPEVFYLGLATEVGEVMDIRQKSIWKGTDVNVEDLTSELGDVLYYITKIGLHYDVDLKDMMDSNIKKREHRAIHGKES